MFLGTYTPRLDDKGRLILPSRFRDAFRDGLVITKGQEYCLTVWTPDEFARTTEELRNAPQEKKSVRDFQRMLFSGASQEIPDKQGRVTVPPLLREYASLDRECVVIGANNHVEVWAADAWAAYSAAQDDLFAGLSEEVLPGVG